MRISTKGEYAVRALVDIASQSGKNPVQIREISKREGISKSYIEQLFVKLRNLKIIKSIRGPKGGYLLAKDASNISIGDIIRAVEGPIALVQCVTNKCCERTSKCSSYSLWKKVSSKIEEQLDSISLKDLCK